MNGRARRGIGSVPVLLILAALAGSGCGGSNQEEHGTIKSRTTLVPATSKEPRVPLPKGAPPRDLVVEDLRIGWGVEAKPGDVLVTKLVARFVGGRKLESSWTDSARPFTFRLGADQANPGWERGIPGMRVGGRRMLIVPPDEGSRFGSVGEGQPKDTLVYVVELISIIPPELLKRSEPKVAVPHSQPPSELVVRDLIKGSGPAARNGDALTVEYVGVHYDGKSFTNSWKRAKPFRFELGAEEPLTNPGWEEGLRGMRVGERRELIIPPKLLFPGGAPPGSHPSDSLVYVVDLFGITETGH